MTQSVFNRYEKKYLLSIKEYEELREQMKDKMHMGPYGSYEICNLYLDTDDDWLIRQSLDKPFYKEKLRLRSYGLPKSSEQPVFLEIKKKFAGIVNKRRISLRFSAFEDYFAKRKQSDLPALKLLDSVPQEEASALSRQIILEIDYLLRRLCLKPRLFLAYERVELISNQEDGFRLTFDQKIRSRRQALTFLEGDHGESLLDEGFVLMESKLPGATPLWFSRLLSEFCLYPSSFSKYGKVYEMEQAEIQEAIHHRLIHTVGAALNGHGEQERNKRLCGTYTAANSL